MNWDDQVTDNIYKEWVKIKSEFEVINRYKIPRWIESRANDVIELHGFSDASMEAYACVIYASTWSIKNIISSRQNKAGTTQKSDHAPETRVKWGALIVKTHEKVKEALSQHDLQVYGWTDSMVVLGWLQGEPSKWRPFVANRVQLTIDVMPKSCWRYVKSSDNPADAASRGLYALQLYTHTLWWQGPTWLQNIKQEQEQTTVYSTTLEAKRKQTNIIQKPDIHLIHYLMNKYSSFNKTIRIVAWLLRTFEPTRKQLPSYLKLSELSAAKMLIIKHVQQYKYQAEIESLLKYNKVKSTSELLKLNPFIDKLGVLRVGGRLENTNLNMEIKHPKIIPRDSRLAELLVDEAH